MSSLYCAFCIRQGRKVPLGVRGVTLESARLAITVSNGEAVCRDHLSEGVKRR